MQNNKEKYLEIRIIHSSTAYHLHSDEIYFF